MRNWLRTPENRNRYLDDLVWLIHDRFGIVCSTTTMSKMKRKWLRVIEFEESGRPLDATTRNALLETHPTLPILHDQAARPQEEDELLTQQQQRHEELAYLHQPHAPQQQQQQYAPIPPVPMMSPSQGTMHAQQHIHHNMPTESGLDPRLDSRIQHQIQNEIASSGVRYL